VQSVADKISWKADALMHKATGIAVGQGFPRSTFAHAGAREVIKWNAAQTSFDQFRFADSSAEMALVVTAEWYDPTTMSPGKH
jgi:hypothetical protein